MMTLQQIQNGQVSACNQLSVSTIYLLRVWLLWLLTHYSEIASVAVLAEAGARAHHALLHRLCQRHHLARQPLLDIVQLDIRGG